MTRSPSTTSRAGNVMLEPTSPGSLSTVTTSSSATFSCLPPQRTIAYTRELSLSFALPSVPRNSGVTTAGSLERALGARAAGYSRPPRLPDISACTNPGRSAAAVGASGTLVPFVRFNVVDPGYAVDPGVQSALDQPRSPDPPRYLRVHATNAPLR